MLSHDLKQLDAMIDAWNEGRPYPTVEAWRDFQRQLKVCIFKAALAELGIDPVIFDAAAAAAAPGSNVTLFPRTQRDQGGGQ